MMEDAELYRAAYRILSRVTPIPADCGRLCRSRCCRGSEEDGMLLFPGEEALAGQVSFLTVRTELLQGIPVGFAVCKGRCNRALRPLSCRIFPYAPYLERGQIVMREDPRAKLLCPLLDRSARSMIDPDFLKSCSQCFELLRQRPDFDRFLEVYDNMLNSYSRFMPD